MHPRRLVCVGQLTADTIVRLDRPLAVADQTTGAFTASVGGSAAVAAHNAALLGLCPVSFSGHVGLDHGGRDGLAQLRAAGVRAGALVRTPVCAHVLVMVDPTGERTMIAAPGSPPWEQLQVDARPGDIVLFEGWHLFEDGPYAGLIRAVQEAGATVAVDVCSASRAADPAAHARRLQALAPDVLLANAAEAAVLGLEPADGRSTLLVHRGPEATHVWVGGRLTRFAVEARECVDATGAGDTFAGALLATLAAGRPMAAAVAVAHAAAGAVVGTRGPLLSHAPELTRASPHEHSYERCTPVGSGDRAPARHPVSR
jgi:ribokinase